jgi:hypothetical protein
MDALFPCSAGDDYHIHVATDVGLFRVFYNTINKIHTKVCEMGGPAGYKIEPCEPNPDGCKTVVFPEVVEKYTISVIMASFELEIANDPTLPRSEFGDMCLFITP